MLTFIDDPMVRIKDIEGFEDLYQSTELGEVFNKKTGKELKHRIDRRGYYLVVLWKNNEQTIKNIHRLLAEHFIDNPNNKECIDHIDRNPLNNSIDNLRWASKSENNMNKKKLSNNTSGFTGIYIRKDGYIVAHITINKNTLTKTLKNTPENLEILIDWRKTKEIELFGEFAPK